jgi:tetratricopeptide (TPR) repeat protein
VPQLARHAELGGLLAEAQRWAAESGDLAMADLAPDEAARWFARALAHATTLDRPDAERADLLVRLGEAATRAGLPTALETIQQGAELAEACGADATLVRAALATDRGSLRFGLFAPEQLAIVEAALPRVGRDDLTTRATLTALLAQCLGHTDQGGRRRETTLAALDLARSSLDPSVLARVAPNLLWALWLPGTGAIRTALAAEATAAVDEMDDPHLAFRLYLAAHNSAVCAGDADRARTYVDRVHAFAHEVGEPAMRWCSSILDGFTAMMEARFAEADSIVAEALELGLRSGDADAFPFFLMQYSVLGIFAGRHDELFPVAQQAIESDPFLELPFRVSYAILCCEVGRREEASTLLHDVMAGELGPIPHDHTRTTTLIALAVVAYELDDVAGAEWMYPQIVPMADEVSFNGVTSQGPISAYVGKLAFLLGRYDEAERYLLGALATAEAFGWTYHRATTLIGLARNRLRADGALDDEGEQWLATAEELCTTHGINSWTKRTEALRAQLATA